MNIIEIDGKAYFELYSTGMAIGHVKTAKGKQYPRKDRIDKTLENIGIKPVVNNGQLFITEEEMYDFIIEAKTDKSLAFRRWVTHEVLPQIRKTGGYIPISKEDTEEEINRRAQEIAKKTVQEYKNLLKEKDEEIIKLTKINDMNSGGDWQKLDYSNAIVRISLNNNQYINVNIQDIKDYLERNYFSKIKETFVDEDGQEWSSNKFKEERKVCNRFKRDKYGNILISQEGRKAIVRYMIKKLNCQLIIDNSKTNNYF